ncbi:hypothetical protein PFISCL1PPCAC_12296, partial [Pristionchus fissidentatus]
GVLVAGDRKFYVNKQSLASQSSYFNNLFFGGFKEKNESEIEIKDVDPKDLEKILRSMYYCNGQPLYPTDVETTLQLAQKFDLKILEDKVENFLLRSDDISIHQKLLLSEKYKLEILKEEMILKYGDKANLITLSESEEYSQISSEMIRFIFLKFCDLLKS